MENNDISSSTILNYASVAGLALGAVSTAYFFITQYLPQLISSPVSVAAIDTLLWGAKFAGCILLMRLFMLRMVQRESGVTSSQTFRLGVYAAIFSALIYSAADLAYILYINPNAITEAFDLIQSQYSSLFDSNTLTAMDSMKEKMPEYTFFSNFLYCSVYGILLSSILSRYTPPRDPFAGFRKDNDGSIEEQ